MNANKTTQTNVFSSSFLDFNDLYLE